MKNLISTLMMLVLSVSMMAQSPNAFNYQAVLRDAGGNILPDRNIALRISILQSSETGTVLYSERHTKQTSNLGLFNLEIGTGSVLSGSFASINWGIAAHYLKIEVDINAGTSYTHFGTSKMLSVPYALFANQLSYLQLDPVNQSVSLQAIPAAASDDPIFEIKNKDGLVMLGVYNEGVRINVLEEEIKGSKSGFAVGSFSREGKGDPSEVMRLTSDSVRFYIPDAPVGKSSKGGFAVGSFSRDAKGAYYNILDLSPEKARIYIDENTSKGSKGGFAVGSFSRDAKADGTEFMNISPLNYFIGHSAGASNTDGVYNSIMGFESAKNNTTGSYNSFFGYQAGRANTNGEYNVFLGYNSGLSNISASSNVFIGHESGRDNTTGFFNVIIGRSAGLKNNGNFNVFIGYESGLNNLAGADNRFSHWNTFIGYQSGKGNTTGWNNLAIGYVAGLSNQTATNQFFIGNAAGASLTEGYGNTFVGHGSGQKTTISYHNTFLGYYSGNNNLTGVNNTFLGYAAGTSITENSENVMIGSFTGQLATGANNVFIGTGAGLNNTGSGNVFIGRNVANYLVAYNDVSDIMMIDNSNTTTPLIGGNFATNRVGINRMPATYTLEVGGTIWANGSTITAGSTTWSDARYKTNITTLSNSLSKLIGIRGVNYNWKNNEFSELNFPEGDQIGVIAQEVEEVFPELIFTDQNGYKSVSYEKFTPILIEALKEQQQQIDELKNENIELRKQTEKLALMEQKYDELLKLIEHLTQK